MYRRFFQNAAHITRNPQTREKIKNTAKSAIGTAGLVGSLYLQAKFYEEANKGRVSQGLSPTPIN